MRIVCLAILVQVALLASVAQAGRTVVGVVRGVYDGDTILMATREDSRLKVRLYGIDAPETGKRNKPGQPYGDSSRRMLMYKVMGRRVVAEIMDTDRYGRTVAVIRVDGRDVNREMVEGGMAWAYLRYLEEPYESLYCESEATARARNRGLWRDPHPVPPWEFRDRGLKMNGKNHSGTR